MNKNPQALLNFVYPPPISKKFGIARQNLGGQAGISLYLSVIILAIILAIVLGLSAILFGQIKMVREMGYSVVAFYAADTGIEMALAMDPDPTSCTESDPCEDILDNGASYSVITLSSGSDNCDATNYCIRSTGTYKGIQRAIEVKK